ncbi:MAG: Chromosomal replication initiator protein DnaA [Firmicutes bacterium ADurb.Bin193]|nr:MAG: Chromosomal replication initiator protein DnaA [Firmicutes bacterium ADurb.Bin193]
MKTASELWEDALPYIKKNVSSTGFATAFTKVRPSDITKNTFVLSVNHDIYRDMLEMYRDIIVDAVAIANGSAMELEIITEDEEAKKEKEKVSAIRGESVLNPKFTFENFIVGKNNEFACAAAYNITAGPVSDSYNPLLIYGGSGLGKTHLLHAVGNAILEKNPVANVMYVTSEKFMNSFIESIRNETSKAFREKFRTIDVLLLDDIQFFAGKDGTQEAFFHTFNELVGNNKQIMMTSDRPPKDIYPLEERLRTRLSGGLMADIKPPDYETRIAILQSKVKSAKVSIPDEIFDLVAQQVKSNIRELEGAIRTIVAYSEISKKDIELDTANRILNDYFSSSHKRKIDADYIIKQVENYFNLKDDEIKSNKRDKEYTYPRQIAMYICRELTQLSLPEIGKEFGGRDHSTVMHSIKKIKSIMQKDLDSMRTINDLIKNIKSSEG